MMLLAGEDSGKAGPLGLLIVVLLGVACYFLFKSMSGHLRKVQHGFDTQPVPRATDGGVGTVPRAATTESDRVQGSAVPDPQD